MSTEFDFSFLIEAFDAPPNPGALAGVLFAEDFDIAPVAPAPEPVAEVAQAPPPPPPVYDEAQLHTARSLGFEQGREAGFTEAAARARLAEEAASTALVHALADADAAAATAARAVATEAARLMLDLLGTALPDLCSRHGAAEAAALAEVLLPMLATQPSLVLRANPHTMQALAPTAARHAGEAPGRIRLVATDAMAEGDVSIEWQGGQALRDTTELRRRFAASLAPLGLDTAQSALLNPQDAKKELADVR